MVSEFMASNDNDIRDEDQQRSDWIEVLNTGDAPGSLNGWFLTDDADDLDKWRFPDVTLKANQRLVVFASGKNRVDPNQQLHTNFRLFAAEEYLALVRPDGVTVAQDFGDQFPTQLEDVSFGLAQGTADLTLVEAGAARESWSRASKMAVTRWAVTGPKLALTIPPEGRNHGHWL